MTTTDPKEFGERLDAAREMISNLCKPRGTEGAREWIMSIPADRARDPDLVISDALNCAEDLVKQQAADIEKLDAAIRKAIGFLTQVDDEPDYIQAAATLCHAIGEL